MPRKKVPRIVVGRKKSNKKDIVQAKSIVYVPKEKTEKEKLFELIDYKSLLQYRFIHEDDEPYIRIEDLQELEDHIYVIRFRSDPKFFVYPVFDHLAREVCDEVRSPLLYVHETKREFGVFFEECAWVIKIGELDREIPIWRKMFMPTKTTTSNDNPSPKKCSHQRWEEFLQSNYKRSLLSVAQELGYSEQNIDLLSCDKNDPESKKATYKKHKKLFDSFLHDEWNMSLVDGRNVLDYFKDLIASWIGEDLLVRALNEYGFTASLANSDSDRVIKTERKKVTGEPDIKIEFEGNTRYLELMDALSHVEKYGQFDLRLSKARNQYEKKTIFLLHGLADNKFILIDFKRQNVVVTYNFPNPRFGNKPCSVVRFEENGIKMHDMAILWETLKDVMVDTRPEPEHYLKLVDFASGQTETIGVIEEEPSDFESSPYSSDESSDYSDEESQQEQSKQESTDEESAESDSQEEVAQVQEFVIEENATEDVDSGEEDLEVPAEATEEEEPEEEVEAHEPAYSAEQWAALNDVF